MVGNNLEPRDFEEIPLKLSVSIADVKGMRDDLIRAAKKTLETIQTPLDMALWLDGHPNEQKALEAVLDDLLTVEDASAE